MIDTAMNTKNNSGPFCFSKMFLEEDNVIQTMQAKLLTENMLNSLAHFFVNDGTDEKTRLQIIPTTVGIKIVINNLTINFEGSIFRTPWCVKYSPRSAGTVQTPIIFDTTVSSMDNSLSPFAECVSATPTPSVVGTVANIASPTENGFVGNGRFAITGAITVVNKLIDNSP